MLIPRFSVSTLLLVVAIVALLVTLFVEKRRYAVLREHDNEVKRESGFIDVDDPTKFHLRMLKCEAHNTWQYRLFVPEDADYQVQLYYNIGTEPFFESQRIAMDPSQYTINPGQHTITVGVGEDLLNPNDLSVQCFQISFEDRRAGISFPRSSLRFLTNIYGNYENATHRLDHFRSHNSSVDTFAPGEVITLVHIKDQSEPPTLIDGEPAEIIIRLAPKEKETAIDSTKT